jgi:hypothetical protein
MRFTYFALAIKYAQLLTKNLEWITKESELKNDIKVRRITCIYKKDETAATFELQDLLR